MVTDVDKMRVVLRYSTWLTSWAFKTSYFFLITRLHNLLVVSVTERSTARLVFRTLGTHDHVLEQYHTIPYHHHHPNLYLKRKEKFIIFRD